MILVIGGTGHVGSEVVKELQKRKANIRLLVRKEDTHTPAGVEKAVGDLLDPVSVEKAMEGVEKLYLLNAVLPDELTQGLVAYDLAKKLKLRMLFITQSSAPSTSRMFHTLPPSWQSKTHCELLMFRSRSFVRTTSRRTMQC